MVAAGASLTMPIADCRMAAQAPYPAYGVSAGYRPDKRSAIRRLIRPAGSVQAVGLISEALSGALSGLRSQCRM
ncbi:hypothetical protein CKO_00453 [Citrobacter koseri ATCC BAA-895]|uniref:Uncharacterized protein n=1 Tax=Citrobacter koseri (strain ATCC BAA-895 / CDC 4225-83 / SGSC4696) TaxID=290338 RepID=A8ADP6_CITK8|nr:hypothetical protein CKO_00453 [Citrobacter koseri ATCC BAA-895]